MDLFFTSQIMIIEKYFVRVLSLLSEKLSEYLE